MHPHWFTIIVLAAWLIYARLEAPANGLHADSASGSSAWCRPLSFVRTIVLSMG